MNKSQAKKARTELKKIYKTSGDIDINDIRYIQEKYNVEISIYCMDEYGQDVDFFSLFWIGLELLNYIDPDFKNKIYAKIDYETLCRDYDMNETAIYYNKYNHTIYCIEKR